MGGSQEYRLTPSSRVTMPSVGIGIEVFQLPEENPKVGWVECFSVYVYYKRRRRNILPFLLSKGQKKQGSSPTREGVVRQETIHEAIYFGFKLWNILQKA